MRDFDAWTMAKDGISAILRHDCGPRLSAWFADVSGDFGIPTASDLEDFATALDVIRYTAAPGEPSDVSSRCESAANVLNLYAYAVLPTGARATL